MFPHPVLFAFGLTLLAGLATGIGSTIALVARRTNTRFLAAALGFSAGVMIYVSFVEILARAGDALMPVFGVARGSLYTALAFFGGMLLIGVIDKLVPSFENPHEPHAVEEIKGGEEGVAASRLLRMGMLSAIAISIHNFPEGLATFIGALKDPGLGVRIAVAIAIHNVPEGIAVSVPLFYATGNRRKAFLWSFLSGLAEPLGALAGYLLLIRFLGDVAFGLAFAAVAGIMVFISIDGLLPAAERYGEHHVATYGVVSGMAVMAASLLLFG